MWLGGEFGAPDPRSPKENVPSTKEHGMAGGHGNNCDEAGGPKPEPGPCGLGPRPGLAATETDSLPL